MKTLRELIDLPGQYQQLRSQIEEQRSSTNHAEQYRLILEQQHFILHELRRLNETMRYQLLNPGSVAANDMLQTRSSFDYQWADFHAGIAMPSDTTFMQQVQELLCRMTDLPADWFPGKTVVDIGCGAGRFTYGLLALGATVTACDQSTWSLKRTGELCQQFETRLALQTIHLLEWDEAAAYDLAFCFGVVHHTGNTYLAIRNAAAKVKPGGKLFLMVYGFPETLGDFVELNAYEDLRQELRHLSFAEKKQVLIERFGEYAAHGWFDAVSPKINDLLTFPELAEFLTRLGFHNIKRTIQNRNHHIIADKLGSTD